MFLKKKTGIVIAFILLTVLLAQTVFASSAAAENTDGTAEEMPAEVISTEEAGKEDAQDPADASEEISRETETSEGSSSDENAAAAGSESAAAKPDHLTEKDSSEVSAAQTEETAASADEMPTENENNGISGKREDSASEAPDEAGESVQDTEPEEGLLAAMEEEAAGEAAAEEVTAPVPYDPEEGIYSIRTALSASYVLDVPGASREAGKEIQIYQSNGTEAQKFRILKNPDGTYRILNMKSDKALQTAGGADKAGTGIVQGFTGTAASMKWKFVKDPDGTVQIVSAMPGGYCLSVSGGKAVNSAKIITAAPAGKENKAQYFELRLLKKASEDKPSAVTEGVYYLRSALDTSMTVDVSGAKKTAGTNVQLYKNNGTNAQKFIITQNGSNTFRIVNLNSFMAVGTQGGKTASATNVEQVIPGEASTQNWIFEEADRGYYYIRNAGSGLYLDVKSARRTNGTNVQIYTGNKTEAQKFRLERIDSQRVIPDGVYTICSKLSATAVLDISGASLNNTANCQLYQTNGTDAQKFTVTYESDGYYTVLSANSGKALDVKGASNSNGANVQQYTPNGTKAQKWKFVHVGNGYHTIYSAVGSDKVLDAKSGRSGNGTNIWIYTSNGTDAQKFMLKPTQKSPRKTYVVEIDPGHQRHGNSAKEPIGPGSSVKKAKCTSGATSQWTGQDEYQLNLDVSLKLRKELEKRGYKVYMTRTTNNVDISNVERAKKATKDGADILVRIHADDIDSTSVSGVLNMAPASGNPYMSSKMIKESQRLAKLLTKYQVKSTGQKTRSNVYTNSMTGINWATMPVSIVEMGLMSNRKEAYNLNDSGFQQKIAKGIADGIDAYFNNENP
ncbi:MAG: RICIN domain-containing protein [Lachnospiraceae bacterium]|nr:RICIN domain-containing protein [Lachnospiraceae bacterium]